MRPYHSNTNIGWKYQSERDRGTVLLSPDLLFPAFFLILPQYYPSCNGLHKNMPRLFSRGCTQRGRGQGNRPLATQQNTVPLCLLYSNLRHLSIKRGQENRPLVPSFPKPHVFFLSKNNFNPTLDKTATNTPASNSCLAM